MKEMEISEYFVYFGIYILHHSRKRSVQTSKSGCFEMPDYKKTAASFATVSPYIVESPVTQSAV